MGIGRKQAIGAAGLGSAALLTAAFGFQELADLPPCELCLWQRWPHAAAAVIAVLALAAGGRSLVWVGLLSMLTAVGLGLFHVGVEQGWWVYVSSCTQGSIAGLSGADLLNPDAALPAPVRCDEVAWSLFGISMAGWNALASAGLASIWAYAAVRKA